MSDKLRNVIGIDPGLTGAIALLNPQRDLLAVEDMPTCKAGKNNEVDVLGLADVITRFNDWDNVQPLKIPILARIDAFYFFPLSNSFTFPVFGWRSLA